MRSIDSMITTSLIAIHVLLLRSACGVLSWRLPSEMSQELLDEWPDWIGRCDRSCGGHDDLRYNNLRNMTVVKHRGDRWRPALPHDDVDLYRHFDILGVALGLASTPTSIEGVQVAS